MKQKTKPSFDGLETKEQVILFDRARALWRRLLWRYVQGSAVAVFVTLFLVFVGLGFTSRQWTLLTVGILFAVPLYVSADIFVMIRHYRPLGDLLAMLDEGQKPDREDVTQALVRCLNLPLLSFLRVTFVHGPGATLSVAVVLFGSNMFWDGGFTASQISIFLSMVFVLASPAHAVFEFFAISREIVPTLNRLWKYCGNLTVEEKEKVYGVGLRLKLLYTTVAITALPLLYLAGTTLYKAAELAEGLSGSIDSDVLRPFFVWVLGLTFVCIFGGATMFYFVANEVTHSAKKILTAMRRIEAGDLDTRIDVVGTDEFGDIFHGFNLMTEGLSDEIRILEVSHELAGEVNLEALVKRIMEATSDLLGAERSTLFLHDAETNQLWSYFAEGLGEGMIRVPDDKGIVGTVFKSGVSQNITDPYNDPRFNPEVDKKTGFRTRNIICMPIANKWGERLGVTQVLNKKNGDFGLKDAARLQAFTAQISVSIENARLFEDVNRIKNYNESILASAADGIITIDAEGLIVTTNAAALKILDLPEVDVLSKHIREVCSSESDWFPNSLTKVFETGVRDISLNVELVTSAAKVLVNSTIGPLVDGNGEVIGKIICLQDMSGEQKVKATMARYMSKEVVDELMAGGESALAGRNQKVSVLFSDIRSFTSIAERLGARETVTMLNEYFEEMVDVIFDHSGVLDKYIGDAMMALFGAPFEGENDANNAVRAADEMFGKLDALNQRRLKAGREEISIGIGIASGEAVVGNIGSPKRLEYTVIGDTVNLASRLEGATKVYGARVLLCENTAAALDDSSLLRPIDLLQVKGKDRPVAVFESMGWAQDSGFKNLEKLLEVYRVGWDAYSNANWELAIKSFEEALKLNPQDGPSAVHLARSRQFLTAPPAENWDGVYRMVSK